MKWFAGNAAQSWADTVSSRSSGPGFRHPSQTPAYRAMFDAAVPRVDKMAPNMGRPHQLPVLLGAFGFAAAVYLYKRAFAPFEFVSMEEQQQADQLRFGEHDKQRYNAELKAHLQFWRVWRNKVDAEVTARQQRQQH
eukprot:gnl/Hemi2/1130_TR406_c0_g3_i1.p2 gnl/Hemi2/1130_TR406_c0_g3~~gnl/Hemi2/1130_TR406_c0_g3_i1.p2  ORF type:complete len:137 (-),score=34.29 gnl/Hemi2/1130_TR406_c0_g3_i1:170-580(-)